MCLNRFIRPQPRPVQVSIKATLLPPLCMIEDIPLIDTSNGKQISSQELWSERPCVILAFRRPGCVLCRDEAVKIWRLKDKLNEMGVSVAGMVHESNMPEIESFRKYWPGPLYYDSTKGFYRALGNGKLNKGTLLPFVNPFSKAWKNVRKAKQSGEVPEYNMIGSGLIKGGILVVGKGNIGIFLSYMESTYGDSASAQEVLDAAQSAVAHQS